MSTYELLVGLMLNPDDPAIVEQLHLNDEQRNMARPIVRKENIALYGNLLSSVSPVLRNIVMNGNHDGKLAYTKLVAHFRGKNVTRTQLLLTNFGDLHQGEVESMTSFISRVDILAEEMANVDEKVSDQRKMQKILTGLNTRCR